MRTFLAQLLVLSQMALMVTPHAAVAKEVSMTPTECKIARVAERYVAVHYPEFDSVKNPPIVHDNGDSWSVEYQLPEGVIGGTPVVVVDKSTLKVVRSYRTQ